MRIVYVLAKPDYFTQGRRGRVAHATGVIAGLQASGAALTVISGDNAAATIGGGANVDVVEVTARPARLRAAFSWTSRVVAAVERVLSEHTVDALMVRYAVSNGFRFSTLFRRHPGLVRCFEVNSLAYHHYDRLPKIIRERIRRCELRALSAADIVYVVSDNLCSDVSAAPGPPARVTVVPNAGHARPEFAGILAGSDAAGDRSVDFVYMGVLQPHYELELVVSAFRGARQQGMDAQLHFYGDGDQYDALRKLADGMQDVAFHGRYDLDSLLSNRTFGRNTVLLLPCKRQGRGAIVSPIKLYEYMSLGLPILASAVGQTSQVLHDKTTCLFYETGSVESCIQGMLRLARDSQLREELAKAVREEFHRNHTWEARMAQLRSDLESVKASK
jgi:glycosyltransferase involved in cell wall biosynthesis